jgi:molecular chaperone GrpE
LANTLCQAQTKKYLWSLEILDLIATSKHRYFKKPPCRMSDSTPQPTQTDSSANPASAVDLQNIQETTAAMANYEAEALTKCQTDLAELQAKSAELADQYLRAKADVENARRRADDEVAKSRKFAVESFADSLLPVIDSLEAGLAIKDAKLEQIQEGVQATLRQLISALERNKVIAINPAAGEKFDPHQHQAISVVPSELEANSVVTVLQKGYLISERVLRPALVTVTAPK